MFDIGFWELGLISVVALLIVGPDRLPKIAYEVGLWFGRLQRFVRKARMDIERELHNYEIKQTLDEQKREIDEIRQLAENSGRDLKRGLKSLEEGPAPAQDSGERQPTRDERRQTSGRDGDE